MRNWFLLGLFGLLLLASAWAVPLGTLPPADLTLCNGDEVGTLDPARATGTPEGRVLRALFEGLCSWHPETLEPVPGVAKNIYRTKDAQGRERWACLAPDGLTYTFHLRREARWSNGQPVTAEDFVWSFRRFLHRETAADYAYELWYIRGAKHFTVGEPQVGEPVEVELPPPPGKPSNVATRPVLQGTLVAVEEKLLGGGKPEKIYQVRLEDGTLERFVLREPTARGAAAAATAPSGAKVAHWIVPSFAKTVAVKALDRHTLRVVLQRPTPYFLYLMGFYPMFPVHRETIARWGQQWMMPEHFVGNGPYVLHSRRVRDRIRLVKSPTYWNRKQVRLEVIDVLAVKSDTTALNMFLTGQVDWVPTVPHTVVPELIRRKMLRPGSYLGTYYYRVNVTKGPLRDVRVRRALSLALDRRQIIQTVLRAGQQPAYSFVPPVINQYLGALGHPYQVARCQRENIELARRLLRQAGYPGGRGFPRIEILYNTSEAHQAVAELIQSQWKRHLGIDVGLRNMEWGAYLSAQREGDYHVARAGWIGDYPYPDTFLRMFHSESANNQTGWKNPEYDRLVDLASQEADLGRRLELYHRAERILMDQLPIIPIYYYSSLAMVRPWVRGWERNVQDVHPFHGTVDPLPDGRPGHPGIWIDHQQKRRLLQGGRSW